MAGLFDQYLGFIQTNFNLSGTNRFKIIVQNLEKYSKQLSGILEKREKARQSSQLARELEQQQILLDFDTYSDKFNNLGNFDIENVMATYNVIDDIVKDVKNARNWIGKYNEFIRELGDTNNPALLHAQLVTLGMSILGRAVELAPIDTGFLRESGVLIDLGTSIVIAFMAPYATYVHEDLNARHEVGRAKFLEVALQEFFPNRRVWTEQHGYDGVYVRIQINPELIEYKHYD